MFTFLAALISIGCVEFYHPVGAPTGVSATLDEFDRIVLGWEPVEFAAGYSVHRSEAEDGAYDSIGSTSIAAYIDIDVGPVVEYWYAVSAIAFRSGAEEPQMSSPVRGTSLHEFAWSVSSVGFNADFVRIADDSSRGGYAFAATAEFGESEISMNVFDGSTWSTIASVGSVETVDGEPNAPFAVIESEATLYVAFSDRTQSNRLTVRSDTSPFGQGWVVVGSAGFGVEPAGRIELILAGENPVVASLVGTAPYGVQVFEYDSDWTAMGDLATLLSGLSAKNVRIVSQNGSVVLIIEVLIIEDTSLNPSQLMVYDYAAGSSWSPRTSLSRPGGDRTLVSIDAAAKPTSSEEELFVGFIDGTNGLTVASHDGSSWIALTSPAQVDPATGYMALTVGDDGTLYLFAREAASLAGVVYSYDSVWTLVAFSESADEITSSLNLGQLDLASFQNRIFAGFVDGEGFGDGASVAVSQ